MIDVILHQFFKSRAKIKPNKARAESSDMCEINTKPHSESDDDALASSSAFRYRAFRFVIVTLSVT